MIQSFHGVVSGTVLQFDGSFIFEGVSLEWEFIYFWFDFILFSGKIFLLAVLGLHESFFCCCCCSLILKRWGTFGAVLCDLASGCHLRIYICSDNRTKTWSRCVRVYPCRVYSSECWRRRLTLFGGACFARVRVWRTVFTPPERMSSFLEFLYICSVEQKELLIFHSFQNKVRRWRMFRGGVWWKSLKGRIRIHLPCHASPPKRIYIYLKAYSTCFNPYEKAQPMLFRVLCCGFSSFLFLRICPQQSSSDVLTAAVFQTRLIRRGKKKSAQQLTSEPAFLSFFEFFFQFVIKVVKRYFLRKC